MIRFYTQNENGINRQVGVDSLDSSAGEIIWVDLLTPDASELQYAEELCGIEMPTQDEMREIEATSRLYTEDGGRFMTTTVLVRVDTDEPTMSEITFILKGSRIVTIRHSDSYSFRVFSHQLLRTSQINRDQIFVGLLETIVDRQADVLERFGTDLDSLSKKVFSHRHVAREKRNRAKKEPATQELRLTLEELGSIGDLITRQRDCLVNLLRLLTYASNEEAVDPSLETLYSRLRPISRDVNSLSEYASFLSNKISFMLDAVLGLINIEQNEIVKIFTVASVIFMPATLIASIYGMNFEYMPEIHSPYGYFGALAAMVISIVLPLAFFRIKRFI
ncbi:MAG: magnesium transporter CorA family protein [Akkermansiaceae bacterium]|nr:magnesium transporter CorA family protein [Akkermansiaceae bacterium]